VVTNELITNAIKHGAPGADGRLHVEVRLACGGDRLCLTVTNSGNPVGANFDVTAHPGLGLRLVDDMVTSMYRGAFRLLPHADGTRAEVTIEDAKLRARRDP
jgi:two-component sensor histidine kinase